MLGAMERKDRNNVPSVGERNMGAKRATWFRRTSALSAGFRWNTSALQFNHDAIQFECAL